MMVVQGMQARIYRSGIPISQPLKFAGVELPEQLRPHLEAMRQAAEEPNMVLVNCRLKAEQRLFRRAVRVELFCYPTSAKYPQDQRFAMFGDIFGDKAGQTFRITFDNQFQLSHITHIPHKGALEQEMPNGDVRQRVEARVKAFLAHAQVAGPIESLRQANIIAV